MNRSSSQTLLTENSLFYKKKQQTLPNNDNGLEFEMEWDPDTKLYTPPKMSPSVFQYKPSINNKVIKEEDEIELMSVDEVQKQNNIINNNINNNNNSNDNSTSNNNKSDDFDLNKISFNNNRNSNNNDSDSDSDNNNILHQKVKKKSVFGQHHFGGLNTSSETQKKLYLTKHSRLSHLNFNNNPFSNNNNNYFYNNHNISPSQNQQYINSQQLQHQYINSSNNNNSINNNNESLHKKIEWYSQYIVRIILVLFSFFIIYLTFNAIVNDVNIKYKQHSSELQKQVEKCVKSYNENRCSPITRIPAMEKTCTEWELCMEKDPTKLPKTRIFAEILSEVLESFVSTMSYKTMAFLICTIWIMIWIPNKMLDSTKKNSNNNNNNSNSQHQIQHQSQPTQSFFAKNLFTLDQGFSKSLEHQLLNDHDDDN